MGTVFSLSATVFQQPVAEISHAVGRKPAFLLVLAVFSIGSVVAATARNIADLLVGRAMQGVASGGSVLSAIVLTDLIELRDRATWLSVQNGIQALGLRWLFWINLPAIAISAAGLGLLLGFDRPDGGILPNLKKIDWWGIIIFTPSAVSLLAPITMAGVLFPWSSWKAIVPLSLGFSGLVALGLHQRYFAKAPMFRARLFDRWVTICGFMGQAVFGVCVNMILYYLVVYWSGVRGFDEILTGVMLLPETFSIPIAAILCGLTIRKTGAIRWAMFVGWPLTVASLGLLWLMDTQTPLAALIVINAGVGLGAGTIASSLNVALLATTRREDNGHAMAMGWLAKSAGMCLGIAIGTAVFTSRLQVQFGKVPGEEMTAESFLRVLNHVKGDPAARDAIVHTLRVLWIICCGLSALVGLLCCLCKYPNINDLRKEQQAQELQEKHCADSRMLD
ncbi:major facilitator superfamily domain-containing protein [Diplogelasinospora grovesii]|uniref:Major facilitator superfamily domain-containing protein n=1 Tax=Diplogelasinospora grovesii TaxID=303347 RepID=A0AAN6S2V5_9PEZI|nr:major facilitator superfamily domain-containing protein [Diplogelasinospora grovesii]